ncbi:MAG: Rpn family recombination-promoting nuclease/putative transposase [Oligoflexia bacterium]|nr:Rpn family recombination-promoting nuclease/putative transposase [Oligoflexia bacterium]
MKKKLKQSKKIVRKKPTCSHDTFFKLIFSDPKLAKELLELLLTKAESKVFNLDDIRFEKDTHKKQFADIVLSFSLKNYPKERAEFFMILEHKSYNDKDFYEQMLKYLYLIRELIIRQTGRAKPVIPAMFFHGKQPLKLKKTLQEEDFKDFLFKIPVETRKSMLNFELKVINTKDPKIRKVVKNKRSKIWGVIKLLDEIWDIKEPSAEKVKTIVRDYFGEILKGKKKREAEEIVIGIVEYLRDTTGLKLKEWEKAEKTLKEEGILKIGGVMNIREVIKEKGIWEGERKGRREGRQERDKEVILNMLKKKADISFISEVTGVPEKEIKKLKNGA